VLAANIPDYNSRRGNPDRSLYPADNYKISRPWIVALPFLAFILVLFSMSRMVRELEILGKVRTAHRARQSKMHHITWTDGSHFTRDVMLYLLGLMVVCIAAGFSLIYIWRPV